MLTLPREAFVPDEQRNVAYADGDLPLSKGRAVMAPRVFAKMLDALNVGHTDMVLEIGCGLGYSTAVIAYIAEAVITVEQDENLAAEAETNLAEQQVDNAVVITAPLTEGSARHGPFDVIVFSGGVQDIPASLFDQLKEDGRVAAIFSDGAMGRCQLGVKSGGRVVWRKIFDASSPVLPGFEKQNEFTL